MVLAAGRPMAAARQDDRPLCHVCLEGDGEELAGGGGGGLVHGGCGCRGSAGFGHLPCLVEAGMHNPDVCFRTVGSDRH